MSTNTLCRLCGKKTEDYIDIFDENGLKKDLSIKASSCLNINVHPNDHLPKIMCVPCCARLDDLYEFLERSTKVQLILSTLYQSNGAISVVKAEHDYAIKIPPETWFPVPENLLKEEYGVPLPNCTDLEVERSRGQNVYETQSSDELVQEKASDRAPFQLQESHAQFHREMEHNYFLPSPELSENKNRISLEQETEHNYYVRSEKMFCATERMETSNEIELNNGFQEATLSQILDGYPWACAISLAQS